MTTSEPYAITHPAALALAGVTEQIGRRLMRDGSWIAHQATRTRGGRIRRLYRISDVQQWVAERDATSAAIQAADRKQTDRSASVT